MITRRPVTKILTRAGSIFLIPLLSILASPITPHLNFGSNPPAIAAIPAPAIPKIRYVPPKLGVPTQTQGTGSRGCPQSLSVSPILLVPNNHVGQTISGHPTFFWHMSEPTPLPIEFSLVESGVAQPLLVQQLKAQKAGVMQLTIPDRLPELVPGRKYRWSVAVICNSNRRSSDVFVQSWVKRVPTPPSLSQLLAPATSDRESSETLRDRAINYARAGLWYDALAAISAASTANLSDSSLLETRLSLLDQVGLTKVSEQERQRLARR